MPYDISGLIGAAYGLFPGGGSTLERDLGFGYAPTGGRGEPQNLWGADAAGSIGVGGGPGRGNDIAMRGFGGMRGAAAPSGAHTAEYYPMGMIPTSSNMEHASQFAKRYRYSDTPDLGKMIRAPWRPETWDPNYDLLPEGGRVPGFSHTGGRRRRRRR